MTPPQTYRRTTAPDDVDTTTDPHTPARTARAVAACGGRAVAQRPHASRIRLLDRRAPYGSGGLA
ncbi:hypothetical protein [Streptomyces sp. MMG1121]|uniref:hypothetical protein n=1 Tax=Streptomyces sp. MMG1121 TaxID=1415544 RepID=UPI0006AE1470|nr:hypothetical protein ADK64_09085 [Streptomyces sp. MMG1121]